MPFGLALKKTVLALSAAVPIALIAKNVESRRERDLADHTVREHTLLAILDSPISLAGFATSLATFHLADCVIGDENSTIDRAASMDRKEFECLVCA